MNNHTPLDSLLRELVTSRKTPGVQYLAIKNGQVIHSLNAGMAEFETQKEITTQSFFNACSVTKTFTSLGVLQLAEAGRLNLNDHISNYLEDIPFHKEIKISQLLSHTSGLPNPIPLRWAHLQEEEAAFNYPAFIKEVLKKHSKLKYTPGGKFSYSNLNYLPLGQLIEIVSGLPYRDYVRQFIFNKIDVQGSPLDFLISDDLFYARGYQKKFTLINLVLGFFIDKPKFTTRSSNSSWIKFNKYYVSGRSYGGLIANASSLTKFLTELFRPGSMLLTDEWKKKLFEKQKVMGGKEVEMTLGWFTGNLKGNRYFAHAGAGGGYYCEMRMYPELQLATAIMFNRSGMGDERILDKPDRFILPH
jgi:D-alanyl-D-alanine carboxypeptidase